MSTKTKGKITGPPPAPKKKPTEGVTVRAKWLLIERGLNWPLDDLCKKLTAEGYTVSRSSMQTLTADFRQSCRVLFRLGKLKGIEIEEKAKAPKAEKPAPKKKKAAPKLLKMLEGSEPVEKKAEAA